MLAQTYTSPYDDENQGHVAPAGVVPTHADHEKTPAWAAQTAQRKRKSRWWLWVLLVLAALALIGVGLGVGLGIGLNRNKKNADSSSGSDQNGHTTHAGEHPTGTGTGTSAPEATPSVEAKPVTGGQGSLLTFADGSTMTYDNPHGGYWYYDEADPFNNYARANSWTPALNETWDWEKNIIKGVNVGGWLNTEPFICPGLYERYMTGPAGDTVDEYTLSINMGANLTTAMTEHYDTFITERDFAEMATYGLNWVRLPIPHWSINKWQEEPYLEHVSWNYVLKAIGWARKYGLRINLDLHTMPGSQNGWNHSGKLGSINFLKGPMGLVNAQRGLEYIRTLTEFVNQPEYAPVVGILGFMNEPNAANIASGDRDIGKRIVASFYLEAYKLIRGITGTGAGNGPMISMHDGFLGITTWFDFLRGADRLMLDQHPYLIFQDQALGGGQTMQSIQYLPCQQWATATNDTSRQFGTNNAGEFSAAVNDCGQWLNGIGLGQRYDGTYHDYENKRIGSCDVWNDYTQWDQATRDSMKAWTMSSMDALQNFFFWTWKIGNSTQTPGVPMPNPMWHYRLGVQEGWIVSNPHEADGFCVSAGGVSPAPFDFKYSSPNMIGSSITPMAAAQTDQYAWPPTMVSYNAASMSAIPQLTQTGTITPLPMPTNVKPGSTETISAGNGWANTADARPAYTAVANCKYPAVYDTGDVIPPGACGAGASAVLKRAAPAPTRAS